VKFRTLTLSAATAALLATGAIAQDRPATTTPSNPPVATPDQPAAQKPMSGTESAAPAASTSATTAKTTTESIQFTSTAGANEFLTSQLIGTPVRNSADEKLGDINDVIVSKEGKPTVAVIGVGGFLGIGEKNVGVPFESLQFTMANQKRIARLDVPKETLQSAPTFVYPEKTAALKTN
jgi:hypothetical protein